MDSVSQAALGAAVGVAVLGRQRPVWQAALAGAAVGTLPDLDVFIDKGDPIRNMVLHRAETHAFFWQLLAAPAVAFLFAWLTRSRTLFPRWWAMVTIGFISHSVLDAVTVYGTQIALPFSNHPFGLGSLFIIDPIYTLPLLLGLMMTLLWRSRHRLRWNNAGLIFSTLYVGWSVGAQAFVTDRVMASPAAAGLDASQVLVTPTPFNTVLWRVVLLREESYEQGFFSLLDRWTAPDRPLRLERFDRGQALEAATAQFADANLIRAFSKGFYALEDDGQRVWITDLRMGQHPYYVFSFAFAERQSEPLRPIGPLRRTNRMPLGAGLNWIGQRMLGEDIDPPRPSDLESSK